jgi:two-component system nitrogen regulation sensor histidine kinase NtrY
MRASCCSPRAARSRSWSSSRSCCAKSADFSPDFLASVLLYGLTVLNISLLLVLLLVLGRNLVRVIMERRRGVLGARFRMRLVIVFVLMAAAPALLLMVVGSDLIQQTVDRWFNVDVERILSSLQVLATAVHDGGLDRSRVHARALAREIEGRGMLDPAGQGRLRRVVEVRSRELKIDVVNVLTADGEVLAVVNPRLPMPETAVSGDELGQAALAGQEARTRCPTRRRAGRVAVPLRDAQGAVRGAVIASTFIPRGRDRGAPRGPGALREYRKAESFKEPIKAVYLSLYLFPPCSSSSARCGCSLYLAPPHHHAAAAGGGRARSGSPPASAACAWTSRRRRRVLRAHRLLQPHVGAAGAQRGGGRAHARGPHAQERGAGGPRRLMETVLETVGTGVVVVDAEGVITALNAAACRLLDVDADRVGARSRTRWPDRRDEIVGLVQRLLSGRGTRQEREVVVPGRGRDRNLAVTVVPCPARPGSPPGAVLVLDDLTPLMRAQKVAAGERSRASSPTRSRTRSPRSSSPRSGCARPI